MTQVQTQIVIAWWRHQMETFSALLAICAGKSPVPVEFPTQRPVTRSFDVFLDLRLNKRVEAGELSRYRANYDVTVMILTDIQSNMPYLFANSFFASFLYDLKSNTHIHTHQWHSWLNHWSLVLLWINFNPGMDK